LKIAGLVIALAGCDQLFGLPDIGVRPDASPDAPAYLVTGTFLQHFVYHDIQFQPMVVDVHPTTVAASVTLDDGTTAAVDYHADGTFAFPLAHPGQAYRLMLDTPDGGSDIESDTPTLQIATSSPTRPIAQRTPVTQQTLLQIRMNGGSPLMGQAWLASTGVASDTNTGEPNGNFDFDWRTAATFGGSIALLDTTDYNDALYVLDVTTSPYYSIAQSYRIAIDQVDGYPLPIIGNLVPANATGCVHLTAERGDEYARLAAAVPGASGGNADWIVTAVPALSLDAAATYFVAYSPAPNPPANADLNVRFANIYDGYPVIASAGVTLLNPVTVPNTTTPFQAYVSSRVYVTIADAATCTGTTDIPSGLAQVAGGAIVAGTPVAADATTVALPASGDVTIAWSAAAPGPVDFTTVTVYELRAVSGITVPRLVDSTITAKSVAHFPASLFAAGHDYIVRFDSVVGFPDAATGDFAHTTYPHGAAESWSRWFTLQ
jgi:hypothetical protein